MGAISQWDIRDSIEIVSHTHPRALRDGEDSVVLLIIPPLFVVEFYTPSEASRHSGLRTGGAAGKCRGKCLVSCVSSPATHPFASNINALVTLAFERRPTESISPAKKG